MRLFPLRQWIGIGLPLAIIAFITNSFVFGESDLLKDNPYDLGELKPIDSELKVASGQEAPDFTLPSVSGKKMSLSQFKGKKNVVLSFVPAAWTPVCSAQWPGYNLAKDMFEQGDAILLGITADNIPTLGQDRLGSCGFTCSLISGPMGRLPTGTACCDLTVLLSGPYFLSTRKASSGPLSS